ncbi:AI-2E family transporter [Clostridium sediminicola]|uniref:AI-2E family transporter n=1 Tax=Clostridium sediminicola TaxID=3114879 RepID=UPI0031F2318C
MEDNSFKDKFDFIFKKIIKVTIMFIVILLLIMSENFRSGLLMIFKPLLIAFAIAYLLDPLVRLFNRKLKISRSQAIAIVVLLIILILILIGAIGIPSLVLNAGELLGNIPDNFNFNFDIINENLTILNNQYLVSISEFINQLIGKTLSSIASISSYILEKVVVNAFRITSSFFSLIVSFVIAIYMLIDKKDLQARIKRVVYAFFKKEDADYIMNVGRVSNKIFSGFLIGKLVDSLIIGILCWIILLFFKIRFAPIIAIIVGITNMIPYFGPFIGAVPAVLIVLLQSPILAFWVLIVIIILQQFDGLVLGPYILGDSVGVGAFWIIVGVTIGGTMFGVVGMLIGVPVLVLLKTIVEEMVQQFLKRKGLSDIELDNINKFGDESKSFIDKIRNFKRMKK